VLLYYITDRSQFSGSEATRRHKLLDKITEAAQAGVNFIQLREKDLPTRELEALAHDALQVIGSQTENTTRLLINSRTDVAIACGADGVHLPANDVSPSDVRLTWTRSKVQRDPPVIGVSCHTLDEVHQAATDRASFAVFAPVFEKRGDAYARLAGLTALEKACSYKIPVFALGGVTLANAQACVNAGAAGVAGIRLFQDNPIAQVVQMLRG
jgi:thiamine-phosphate pyrophosphorylase